MTELPLPESGHLSGTLRKCFEVKCRINVERAETEDLQRRDCVGRVYAKVGYCALKKFAPQYFPGWS